MKNINWKNIDTRISRALSEQIFPGCVVGVVDRQGEPTVRAYGRHTYAPDAPVITPNSIFDVASITKSIPTSSAALLLIQEGKLNLHDRVIDIIPELTMEFKENITVFHLLTHTLDFGFRLSSYKNMPPKELLAAIFAAPLKVQPGTSFFYSNATSILLGQVVERIGKKRLDQFAAERFFESLKMDSTGFYCNDFDADRIVPTEIDLWRNRTICGEVHDESAWALRPDVIAGSAGLFSTAGDLLIFLKMILSRGLSSRGRVFEESTIDLMSTNQLEAIGLSAALGWELNQPRYMGHSSTPRTFGKTGFTGCVCVCDPLTGVGYVLLSNYTWPHRKKDASLINEVRCDISDLILGKLM